MDLAILNHGHVTSTAPEMASPSPYFHITSTGGRLNLDRFNVHRSPIRRVFSGTRLEIMTRHPRVRYLDQ
ncbi:hypothetical protein TNCV_3863371 [Trichonephila clavipes]|uniref:Uncharacterized protein n=1 Tax=Trichonephila clavipes TaxID=2585209 RepID=A0A8X6SFH9_TRICX|nr:hypothetical protein TNCV_3863371 [Trichonephila clavipes]